MKTADTASLRDPRFIFWNGDIVRLVSEEPHLSLQAGDQGYVWGIYDTEPPLYEADFYRQDGTGVAMMFEAEQVELVSTPDDVCIPSDVLEFWGRVGNYKPEAA